MVIYPLYAQINLNLCRILPYCLVILIYINMTSKGDNELHNVYRGDYLSCQACGHVIWAAPLSGLDTFKFSSVRGSYFKHLQKCFGLKKLVVKHHLMKANPGKYTSQDTPLLDSHAQKLLTGEEHPQHLESIIEVPSSDQQSIHDDNQS